MSQTSPCSQNTRTLTTSKLNIYIPVFPLVICRGSSTLSPNRPIILTGVMVESALMVGGGQYLAKVLRLQTPLISTSQLLFQTPVLDSSTAREEGVVGDLFSF